MGLEYIDQQSASGTSATINLNASGTSLPGHHLKRLILRIQIATNNAASTFDGTAWGTACRLIVNYKSLPGQQFVSSVCLSALDFLQRENVQGLNRSPIDLTNRSGQTNASQEVEISIEPPYHKLRDPDDCLFPIDEVGNIQVTLTNTGIGVGTVTGFVVQVWAETTVLKTPHLGPLTCIRQIQIPSSGVLNFPVDGGLPLLLSMIDTNIGATANLKTACPNGLTLMGPDGLWVNGSQAQYPERVDMFWAEPHYYQQDGIPTAGFGPWSVYGNTGAAFARIWRCCDNQSLAELPYTQQLGFVALSPSVTDISNCALVGRYLLANTDSTLQSRRANLGLPPMIVAPNQDDPTKSLSAQDRAKLPAKLYAPRG